MKHTNIKILPFVILFLCFTNTVMAVSDVTEFLPNPLDGSIMASQQAENVQIFEQAFKGVIPDQALYAITRPTQTNSIRALTADLGFVFTKNLKLGDIDSDVLALQKMLNASGDAIVATSGAGSPGNETNYFGQRTKTAVIKYQNKYAKEVLIPVGLTLGTGYFGVSTRAFINNSQKTTDTTAVNLNVVRQPAIITSLEPTHGKDGTVVTIHGSGITRTANKIIAGGDVIINAKSTDGKTLTFTMHGSIPEEKYLNMSIASSTYIKEHFFEFATSTFTSFKYPVCFANDNGLSNCAFFAVDL
jgi:hypothetical protein